MAAAAPPGPVLQVLGGFRMTDQGRDLRLAAPGQRLVAYLALHGRPVRRSELAGTLWFDTDDRRGAANLRSTLCRLPRAAGGALVRADQGAVELDPAVRTDLTDAEQRVRELADGVDARVDPGLLSHDLLPHWDDDWVLVERERYRQLRLHALELLCTRHREAGRFADALHAGLAAVAGEPLRESAHRRVIEVHLAEGNAAEALRQYGTYRVLLREAFGIGPSPAIRGLVAPLLGRPTDVRRAPVTGR